MPGPGHARLIHTTAATLLLAAGVFGSPQRAAAACGDYVTIEGQSAAGHDAPPVAGDELPPPFAPRKPCKGPGCSGSPAPASAPLTAPVSFHPSVKQLLARTETEPQHQPAAGWGRATDSADRPVRIPSDLLDPPRAF